MFWLNMYVVINLCMMFYYVTQMKREVDYPAEFAGYSRLGKVLWWLGVILLGALFNLPIFIIFLIYGISRRIKGKKRALPKDGQGPPTP